MATITTDERRYRTLVTAKGKEKIAAATLNGEKVNIIQAAVGDGGGAYCEPDADMIALVNEVWRGDIANKQINADSANMVDVKVIIPADVGGFTLREAGLFDDSGDLICVCNMPDTEKAVITSGAAGTLTLIIHIVFTDVDAVTFTVNSVLDAVTIADVERMLAEHDSAPEYQEQLATAVTTVVNQMITDGTLPDGSVEVDEIKTAIQKLISDGELNFSGGSNYACSFDIVLSVDGWTEIGEARGSYNYQCDVPLEGATSELKPFGNCALESVEDAASAGMAPECETLDGAIRFYAKSIPAKEITVRVILFGRASASESGGTGSGNVTPGKGLEYSQDGTLNVKIGEGMAFDANEALTVNQDTVMTEGDLVNETEVIETVRDILVESDTQVEG